VPGIRLGSGKSIADRLTQALITDSSAYPPFPSPEYFPFQSATGIHTSILISESSVSFTSAVIRQNAGTVLKKSASAAGFAAPGGTNVLAAIVCADAIVVSGNFSAAKLSQVAPIADIAAKPNTPRTADILNTLRIFTVSSPSDTNERHT
jgi:hypothetical protein